MNKWMPIALLATTVAAFTASSEDITGNWYTEGVEDGHAAQFVIENRRDGTFAKHIRDNTVCEKPMSFVEKGRWKFDGKTMTEITENVDGKAVDATSPEFTDAFTVHFVDRNHLTLYDLKTKITWTNARVPDKFSLPTASNCGI